MVLDTLRDHQLYANKKKCSFAQERVEYLGHIVLADGVSADQSKVAAMLEWPVPKTLKALRGFFGAYGVLPPICARV